MFDSERISSCFEAYHQRYLAWKEWEDRLLVPVERDLWLDTLRRRACAIDEIYRENDLGFGCLLREICAQPEELSEDQFEMIYNRLHDMYVDDWADPFVLNAVARLLEPHFPPERSVEHASLIWLCLAYANIEISRTGQPECGEISRQYYEKLISLTDRFVDLPSPDCRRRVLIAYANIIMVEPSLGNCTLQESYDSWRALCALRQQPDVLECGEREPNVPEVADMYIEYFRGGAFELAPSHADTELPELWREITALIHQKYDEELRQHDEAELEPYMVLSYYRLLEREGKISAADAWRHANAYFEHRRAHPSEDDDLQSLYLNNAIQLTKLLWNSDLPLSVKRDESRRLRQVIEAYASSKRDIRTSYTLNCGLTSYVFDPDVLRGIDSRQEKLHFLFRMVISRHISTFLHSLGVARLSVCLIRCALRTHPELFLGFHGLDDLDEVRAHSAELTHFCYEAALLHDIGKNGLIDIINTQYRRISDLEFEIIRSHPGKGADYLSVDCDFSIYQDVAHGHHRFYDGSGGYPMDFDNCASPDRIMIDLVTLCDCLDAATDYLGRNYRAAKTVDQVIAEFRRDAGVRYHPVLTQLLSEDASLREELREITGPKRQLIYYNAYRQYFLLDDGENEPQ